MEPVGGEPTVGRRWWLVLLATSIGGYIVAANLSTVNVANPSIRQHFDASLSSVSWIVTAYAIVFAALLVPAGRVADRYGRRMLYVSGLCVFATGSLVSGVGSHLWIVVVGRVIQGIGAAFITPSAIGLLLEITPPARRTRALAWTGGVSAIGVATGPTLGAIVVDHLGWRWSFLIAPPFALISYAIGRDVLPRTRQPDAEGRIDLIGLGLAIAAMGLVTLAISEGRRWGWASTSTVVVFAVGALCTVLFVLQCRRHPAPVLPLRLFRARSFTVASIAGVVYGVASGSILFVNVFFLTQIWGYSPSKAGFSMIPGPAVASLVALFVGRFGSKYGERALAVPGSLILGLGIVLYVWSTDATPDFWREWFVGAALTGVGVMLVFPMLSSAGVRDVEPHALSVATAAIRGAIQFGQATGVAISAAVLGPNPNTVGVFHNAWLVLVGCCIGSALVCMGIRPQVRKPAVLRPPGLADATYTSS
ncbi:MAG TPA: MFS transporter [Acidimicrobiales bacterium]|nr:MFS transporter [Acidimicrobiales bacterium]